MRRFPTLSGSLLSMAIDAWWESMLDTLEAVGAAVIQQIAPRTYEEYLDRKHQLGVMRSVERDQLDADLVGGAGGDFEGSGTGGQD